ncbi:MAG: protein-L-isoaspartate(D-aspartate) O-methyltransferase [Desulfohalobiaceae bacterium]|nr:protein-L-isoaspartate(D-aspartate) O-methyltransferase [Desulfohalobiaceae bacterium]
MVRGAAAVDQKFRRQAMVRDQLRARGIQDEAVLAAMGRVKRHEFVEEALQAQAYSDNALPIGYGQTISQPFVVARMSSLLQVRPGMRVLEIGTGSGYQAAVLAEMGAEVFSVERIKSLYLAALKRLNAMRYFRVKLKLASGTLGWPEEAPFDRILVTAGGKALSPTLLDQLDEEGVMLSPLEVSGAGQRLFRVQCKGGRVWKQDVGGAHFVRLVQDNT